MNSIIITSIAHGVLVTVQVTVLAILLAGAVRDDPGDCSRGSGLRRASGVAFVEPQRPAAGSDAPAQRRPVLDRGAQRAGCRGGGAGVHAARGRRASAPKFHRAAAGGSRLSAAARHRLAGRCAARLRQPRGGDAVSRWRGALRRSAAGGRRGRPERRAAARPQPDVGRPREGCRLSSRAGPDGIPPHHRRALPAGDADPASRRALLRRAR